MPQPVFHVITRLVRGGAQRGVLDLLRGLPRSEFALTLIAGEETGSEGSLWDEAEALSRDTGVRLVRLPCLVRRVSPLNDWRAYRQLRSLFAAQRPAIVHAHTSKAGLLACVAARKAGIPNVIFAPHGHIFGTGAKIPGVPAFGPTRWLMRRGFAKSVAAANVVIAPNEAEKADGVRLRVWPDAKCRVVTNGIDVERFQPADKAAARAVFHLPAQAFIVGVVARLSREKGVDLAIQALAHLPDALLVIAGDGPLRIELEMLAARLGVSDRVRFLGRVDNPQALYPATDLCVVPSRSEAHGLVAAEALACGIPVVATRVGGLVSVVSHERTGLLVEAANPQALATGIVRLRADPALRAKLAAAARPDALARHSLGAMIDATAELYRELLAGHSG